MTQTETPTDEDATAQESQEVPAETAEEPTVNAAPDETPDEPRERSTISFPYGGLDDGEEIARAVFEWGGNNVALDSIAATLKTTVKSSALRTKIATSRIFGLVEGRGDLSLTQLGKALIDPKSAASARADAFLSVPLFRKLFEAHRGQVLPGPKGLEAEMVRLGVTVKQAWRARQIFQRSAQHAGFFDEGAERLVMPKSATSGDNGKTREGNSEREERNVTNFSAEEFPPEVTALLKRLLTDGDGWAPEAIKDYLKSVRSIYQTLST